jgi:hypothetical protein
MSTEDANLFDVIAVMAEELSKLTEKVRNLKRTGIIQSEVYSALSVTLFKTIEEMTPEQLATCLLECVSLKLGEAIDLSGITKTKH